jgi:hypothetical protein
VPVAQLAYFINPLQLEYHPSDFEPIKSHLTEQVRHFTSLINWFVQESYHPSVSTESFWHFGGHLASGTSHSQN